MIIVKGWHVRNVLVYDDHTCTVVSAGASSGIGAGTAVLFAELGASLSLTGRNEDNLKKTGAQCQEKGDKQV